jgi:hypothetical protein
VKNLNVWSGCIFPEWERGEIKQNGPNLNDEHEVVVGAVKELDAKLLQEKPGLNVIKLFFLRH